MERHPEIDGTLSHFLCALICLMDEKSQRVTYKKLDTDLCSSSSGKMSGNGTTPRNRWELFLSFLCALICLMDEKSQRVTYKKLDTDLCSSSSSSKKF
ncbi:hypothetical protein CEXT_230101 [Caerostris extrusa]|uniref:Uncharacterized protein n=1 Tax=Caerostris extrusa TaxID=172846 RepID=A0AAV4UJB7_CAEEX|nr:hypothetical protein CEXT_230101 [Caerostris extrusa]